MPQPSQTPPRYQTGEPGLPFAVALEKSSNLRDLGGYRTGDKRVRRGLVFRAPALVELSKADKKAIAALGLRTICDFRGTRERARSPVNIPKTETLSMPIEPSVGGSLAEILRTGEDSGDTSSEEMMALLRRAYEAYALQSAPQYRALFEAILGQDRLPLLLHCSAGKDRTGFGSALLLSALGVSWEDVMADYLATNRLWKRETASAFDLPPIVKEALLGAHGEMLEAAFGAIRGEFGSLDTYLASEIGLDGTARERLASILLEP